MSAHHNPDWRYANMTRTEIEVQVKLKSSFLTSHKHTIPQSSGRQIKFIVTEKDIEHLVSDALYRAHGVFFLTDISELPSHFQQAKYIKTERDSKSKKANVFYHYYELILDNRKLYLNIKEDRQSHQKTLHSVTSRIKMPTS